MKSGCWYSEGPQGDLKPLMTNKSSFSRTADQTGQILLVDCSCTSPQVFTTVPIHNLSHLTVLPWVKVVPTMEDGICQGARKNQATVLSFPVCLTIQFISIAYPF